MEFRKLLHMLIVGQPTLSDYLFMKNGYRDAINRVSICRAAKRRLTDV